jgi:hypothetical protein
MNSSEVKTMDAEHGGGVRGADNDIRSTLYEGRFGRMFSKLPPAVHKPEALMELGQRMLAGPEQKNGFPIAPQEKEGTIIQDDEENSGIPAGYTYFGQFIDHDITFDPASLQQQINDPDAMVDFRTPRLDLDSVYGRGPADQPYMYLSDGRFRLGRPLTSGDKPTKARDLPRFVDNFNNGPARALIGDKRNDENVIISQLHAAFLQLHNRFMDHFGISFEEAQALTRWHYQFVVINDFLVRICGADIVDKILPNRKNPSAAPEENKANLRFFNWKSSPFMPLEFAVAAYRFGHSMVRPIYRLNTELKGPGGAAGVDENARGIAGRLLVFAGVQQRGLNGFGEFPSKWAIDWGLFFDINGSGKNTGMERVQPAYKIDTSVVNPLGFLPEFSEPPKKANGPSTVSDMQSVPKPGQQANLAKRNLLRGLFREMPSGQAVARAMGLEPVPDADLKVSKAVLPEYDQNKSIIDVDPSFRDNAPLWFYILAEAQYEWRKIATDNTHPMTLGPVGSTIVAETLIGLIQGDPQSYLRQRPNWIPQVGGLDVAVGDLIDFAINGNFPG